MNTLNNTSSDEDNILDQTCLKQICSNFYHEDIKFLVNEENTYLKKYSSLQEKAHKIGF